jgi:hypothetical protein
MYFLILLGNMSIKSLRQMRDGSNPPLAFQKECRQAVILCARGLESQGQSYHLGNLTSQALQDRVAPEDLHILQSYCKSHSADANQNLITRHLHSRWPIPIIKIDENPEGALLDHLLERYLHMSLENTSESSQADTCEN